MRTRLQAKSSCLQKAWLTDISRTFRVLAARSFATVHLGLAHLAGGNQRLYARLG
jgi:hypothetical protein